MERHRRLGDWPAPLSFPAPFLPLCSKSFLSSSYVWPILDFCILNCGDEGSSPFSPAMTEISLFYAETLVFNLFSWPFLFLAICMFLGDSLSFRVR